MSVRVMSWIWDNSDTIGTARLLLLAIADNADHDGRNAWPSIATLVRKTRLSERTIQRTVKELEAGGHIELIRGGGRGNTHLFRVLMEPRQPDTPPEPPEVPTKHDRPLPPDQAETDETGHIKGANLASPETAPKGATAGAKGCQPEQERVPLVTPEPSRTIQEPSAPNGAAPAEPMPGMPTPPQPPPKKPKRQREPKEPKAPDPMTLLAQEITAAYWDQHKTSTALPFLAIRTTIRAALRNGANPDTVREAVTTLAAEGRPVIMSTLTTALSRASGNGTAGRNGHRPYQDPGDLSGYYGKL